ncbi:CxC2 domain-containing protein [Favolaschia claudopus]|uniref:CxC2 domain-containing protein n=1 Tax=Favolaschia claudopus TaxID=2862362 RepID=A0AAW0BWP3_9AGAR
MAYLNVSPTRAPNTARHIDSFIEYETRSGDTTRDSNFHSSQDGRRKRQDAINIQPKKRKVLPSDLNDTFGDWIPLQDDNTGADGEYGEDEDGANRDAAGEKRKRYDSSDDPMKLWRPLVGLFLDEMIRHDGLPTTPKCACCGKEWLSAARKFRCKACGIFLQCIDCVLQRHELAPLHSLEEWNGRFWDSTSLTKLDFVYQLGHGGHSCPHPAPAVRQMVVMDFPRIHTIKFRYCACDLSDYANNLQQLLRNGWYPATTVDPGTCVTFSTLETFRLLNVVGNLTVHDGVRVMERGTDAGRMNSIPDRYKGFGRVTRQFAFLKRLKRAGRAHDVSGVAGTKSGECAMLCWACPQEGRNLPQGWREVSPEFQFVLHSDTSTYDANFHMRNRLRANQRDDPPLGDGWAYMVEESGYHEHLRNYVGEEDALLQKDTRVTTGLRCSGVGGVVCARHELMRPRGVGDLQKGERYSNMDYIVLSSVLGILALFLAISYDIACQWQVKFPNRMKDMPEHLQLDLTKITLLFALPVWHAAAHERSCQAQNSLTYTKGVGRTDGEGIERTWSRLNTLGWATREMGRGARADAIDDRLDHHNWEKNMSLATSLPHKLVVAIDERDKQIAGFEQVDSTLEDGLREEWQGLVDALKIYRRRRYGEVAWDEYERFLGHGSTIGGSANLELTFLAPQGLRFDWEIKHRPLLLSEQTERLSQMRRAFFVKVTKFRRLQAVYMPGAVEELMEEEDARDSELPAPQAEDVRLYMPSGLPAPRRTACSQKILDREAEAKGGPDDRVRGQRAGTRSAVLSERVELNIQEIAKKGEEDCTEWKVLRDEDIRGDNVEEVDMAARRKLGRVGATTRERYRSKVAGRKDGKGGKGQARQTANVLDLTSGGGPGEDEQEFARSRADRVVSRKGAARSVDRGGDPPGGRNVWLWTARFAKTSARGLRAYAARQAAKARCDLRAALKHCGILRLQRLCGLALADEAGMDLAGDEEGARDSGDEVGVGGLGDNGSTGG